MRPPGRPRLRRGRRHVTPGSRRGLLPRRGPCADQRQRPPPFLQCGWPARAGRPMAGPASHRRLMCGFGWWCGALRRGRAREQGRRSRRREDDLFEVGERNDFGGSDWPVDVGEIAVPRRRCQVRTESPNSEGWVDPEGPPSARRGNTLLSPVPTDARRSSRGTHLVLGRRTWPTDASIPIPWPARGDRSSVDVPWAGHPSEGCRSLHGRQAGVARTAALLRDSGARFHLGRITLR